MPLHSAHAYEPLRVATGPCFPRPTPSPDPYSTTEPNGELRLPYTTAATGGGVRLPFLALDTDTHVVPRTENGSFRL